MLPFSLLFIIVNMWKQPKYPSMNKETVVYMYIMEYYSAFEKKILPFATAWMNLEDMLHEISQKKKEKCCMISLLCRISKSLTTSSRMVIISSEEVGEMGTKLQLCRVNKSRHLMYIMISIVNSTISISNLLRE